MAAPRKYPEPARRAMFDLYERGVQPAEIARRCEAGLPGHRPFRIPRRTVADIVARMARERGEADLPRRIEEVLDAPGEELAARYPKVVLGLISADAERLRRKIAHDKLTLEDYNRLRCAAALYRQITASNAPRRRGAHSAPRGRGKQEESPLDRLARLAGEAGDLEQRRERERDEKADGQTGAEGRSPARACESDVLPGQRSPACARESGPLPGRAEATS